MPARQGRPRSPVVETTGYNGTKSAFADWWAAPTASRNGNGDLGLARPIRGTRHASPSFGRRGGMGGG